MAAKNDPAGVPASSKRKHLTRRRFLFGAIATPLLTLLYTWRVEPVWCEMVRRDLPIDHLPDALVGKTLVQLSDIHIGPQVDDDYVAEVFRRVTALNPDIVVNTGDLVTYDGPEVIDQARALMKFHPRGRLGSFAVLGNHDYGKESADPDIAQQVASLFSGAGLIVLRNQPIGLLGLRIVGLDDLWAGRFNPAGLFHDPPNQPVLALCHNPDACDLAGWGEHHGWILAGHTHGGQCKPPFLPPPLVSVHNRRYVAGEYSLINNRRLYINRGVGHLLRVRFNARPEVTVFRLTRA